MHFCDPQQAGGEDWTLKVRKLVFACEVSFALSGLNLTPTPGDRQARLLSAP